MEVALIGALAAILGSMFVGPAAVRLLGIQPSEGFGLDDVVGALTIGLLVYLGTLVF